MLSLFVLLWVDTQSLAASVMAICIGRTLGRRNEGGKDELKMNPTRAKHILPHRVGRLSSLHWLYVHSHRSVVSWNCAKAAPPLSLSLCGLPVGLIGNTHGNGWKAKCFSLLKCSDTSSRPSLLPGFRKRKPACQEKAAIGLKATNLSKPLL
jgi:hypothetical protein